MSDNVQIIESLKRIQEKEKLTDGQMAQSLGCTRQLYQATKTGKISVGLTILKGSCKAFPELIGDAVIFLTNGAQEITTLPKTITPPTTKPSQTRCSGCQRVLRGLARAFSLGLWGGKTDQATKSKSEGDSE